MLLKRFTCLCLATIICWAAAQAPSSVRGNPSRAVDEKKAGKKKKAANKSRRKTDLNLLSMEVAALEALRRLDLSLPQLEEIAHVASEINAKPEKRGAAKAGNKFANSLDELREALLMNDARRIGELQKQLEKISEKNPPTLDDGIAVTNGACERVETVLRILNPSQAGSLLSDCSEDLEDPVHLLSKGIEEGRKLKKEEWDAARDELADETAWLVAGANRQESARIRASVVQFLNEQRNSTVTGADLDKQIRKVIGAPSPITIVKNQFEHDIAVLLSNPQLREAARACIDHAKKK